MTVCQFPVSMSVLSLIAGFGFPDIETDTFKVNSPENVKDYRGLSAWRVNHRPLILWNQEAMTRNLFERRLIPKDTVSVYCLWPSFLSAARK